MSTESEDLLKCTDCILHQWRTQVVPGSGPIPCDVMLIGEAPGKDENILGKPFVGRAGGILKQAIEKAGYTRDSVYITNMVKCRPPDNRPPTQTEVIKCKRHLREELKSVQPKKIILLGRTAKKRFYEHFFTEDDERIISVYHPAYALHAPDMREIVIDQIAGALCAQNS